MQKIIRIFWISCLFATFAACAASPESLAEKRRSGLISRGYDIVTADDLAQDARERTSGAYDHTKNQLGRYWQCVPTTTVKRDYNVFMDEDPMGPTRNEILMCDLEIIVDLPTGRHVYGDRRRHPNSFCRQFERNWRRLTQGEKIVCFNGDDPSNENDTIFGKYRAWVWNKFKTTRGCYSYFGDCDSDR